MMKGNSVPEVKSWVPYLGYGIDFSKDAFKMVTDLQKRYGDEFTLKMAGKSITFLLNPLDFGEFLKQAKTLRADPISIETSRHTFGIEPEDFGHDFHETMSAFDKAVRPNKIGALTRGMHDQLEKNIFAQASGEWQEGELFLYIAKLIFSAGGEAFFGEGVCEDSLFEEFLHYDRQFPLLMTGLPRWLFFPRSNRYLKRLYRLLSEPHPNQSAAMDERFENMEGRSPLSKGRVNAGLFWATQANTVVMAFYSVFYIMRDPEVRSTILEEIRSTLDGVAEKTSCGTPLLTIDVLRKLKKLDACLDEALRLKTEPMPVRQAMEDMELKLVSGRVLRLKEGNIATLYPRMTHMNPEIYKKPEDFVWDRFLDKQGANHFSYRGTPLKHNFLPFGGGISICPGRHFAKNEFKILTTVMLYHFDIELLKTEVPEHSKNRAGLGAMAPLSEIPFRYRLRKNC